MSLQPLEDGGDTSMCILVYVQQIYSVRAVSVKADRSFSEKPTKRTEKILMPYYSLLSNLFNVGVRSIGA